MSQDLRIALVFLLLCFVLTSFTGCASVPESDVRIEREIVQVPVPVKPEAPTELRECGRDKPQFQFYGYDPNSADAVILERDQEEFTQWVEKKNRCIEAWKRWESTR